MVNHCVLVYLCTCVLWLQYCEAHLGQAGRGAEYPSQTPCRESTGLPRHCPQAIDRVGATSGGEEEGGECEVPHTVGSSSWPLAKILPNSP